MRARGNDLEGGRSAERDLAARVVVELGGDGEVRVVALAQCGGLFLVAAGRQCVGRVERVEAQPVAVGLFVLGAQLDQVLAQHLATRKRLQDDLLDDQQESVTFDVHGANVADVLEARFQLLEAFRAKEETHEGTENEDPIRTLALTNADLWKAYIPLALKLIRNIRHCRTARARADPPLPPRAYAIGAERAARLGDEA